MPSFRRRDSSELRGGEPPPSWAAGISPPVTHESFFNQNPFNQNPFDQNPFNETPRTTAANNHAFQQHHQLAGFTYTPQQPLRPFDGQVYSQNVNFSPMLASAQGHAPLLMSLSGQEDLWSTFTDWSPKLLFGSALTGSSITTASPEYFKSYPPSNTHTYLPYQNPAIERSNNNAVTAQGYPPPLQHELLQSASSHMPPAELPWKRGFDWRGAGITLGPDQVAILGQPESQGANNLTSMSVYPAITDDRQTFIEGANVGNYQSNAVNQAAPSPINPSALTTAERLHQGCDELQEILHNWYRSKMEGNLESDVRNLVQVSGNACRSTQASIYQASPQPQDLNALDANPIEDEDSREIGQPDNADALAVESLYICPYALEHPDQVHPSCLQRCKEISYVKTHLLTFHHEYLECPNNGHKKPTQVGKSRFTFDSRTCALIGQRLTKGEEREKQYKSLCDILFGSSSWSPNPFIANTARCWLKETHHAMERGCRKKRRQIYNALTDDVKTAYPESHFFGIAFCMWLPDAVEKYTSIDPQNFGDFLPRIQTRLSTLFPASTHAPSTNIVETPPQRPQPIAGQQLSAVDYDRQNIVMHSEPKADVPSGAVPGYFGSLAQPAATTNHNNHGQFPQMYPESQVALPMQSANDAPTQMGGDDLQAWMTHHLHYNEARFDTQYDPASTSNFAVLAAMPSHGVVERGFSDELNSDSMSWLHESDQT